MEFSKFAIFCILMETAARVTVATMEQDEKDCADQLANLAACIPYVSGPTKKPTPECCEDTKKVRIAKSKCLCVLIIESLDTSVGLPINTTLALQMPSACNIDAKVSDCPSILNLPADSPDAKIFKEADGSSTATNSPPVSTSSSSSTPSTSSAGSGSGSGSSSETKTTTSSNSGAKLGGRLLVIMGLASTALI